MSSATKKENLKLRRSFVLALLVLLIAFAVCSVATFAWYIYTINAHTTNVHMAAGASVSLQISKAKDGDYGTAAVLDAFVGSPNPVSTDRIQNGFQKVAGFTNGKENQPLLVANLFKAGEDSDFYKTTLWLRTNGAEANVYLSDISFEDSSEENPISTAIRIGFGVPSTEKEYIFAITDKKNPKKAYNTATGEEGCVLDSTKTDGTTVPFAPYTADNFCLYNDQTGVASRKEHSVPLFSVKGAEGGGFGEPVQLDIYIWLEGCDEDCTANLIETTLSNIALGFAACADAAPATTTPEGNA